MPGTTSLTLSNEQLSANLFHQVEELRAMKDVPYRITEDCLSNSETIDDAGERAIVRWDVDDHSRATRVSNGYERWDDYIQPTLQPGYQTWAIVVQPVMISEVDEGKNSGKAKIIDLLRQRTENVYRHKQRQLQRVLLKGPAVSGTWTGVPGWEDFLTLNGADSTTGIIEAAASGTNTLHNVSKATYPATSHPRFHNGFRDAAGSASTNLLHNMYGLGVLLGIKDGTPKASESKWYVSENCANWLKRALRPQEQYVGSDQLDDGKRMVTMYNGTPLVPTFDLPNLGSATTANPWSALQVNWKRGVRMRFKKGWKMDWTEFSNIPGTVGVRAALCRTWGQLIALEPGLCSLVVDAEAY